MKIKLLTINLFAILALSTSCSLPCSEIDSTQIPVKESCSSVSSETAVLIAQGYMFSSYDLLTRKVKVETENEMWKDRGEMWRVTFYRKGKDRDIYGGDPVVWIFKNNGEIFNVKHQK